MRALFFFFFCYYETLHNSPKKNKENCFSELAKNLHTKLRPGALRFFVLLYFYSSNTNVKVHMYTY